MNDPLAKRFKVFFVQYLDISGITDYYPLDTDTLLILPKTSTEDLVLFLLCLGLSRLVKLDISALDSASIII